jgi:hypothetical protein
VGGRRDDDGDAVTRGIVTRGLGPGENDVGSKTGALLILRGIKTVQYRATAYAVRGAAVLPAAENRRGGLPAPTRRCTNASSTYWPSGIRFKRALKLPDFGTPALRAVDQKSNRLHRKSKTISTRFPRQFPLL